jgi:hypothetical protein
MLFDLAAGRMVTRGPLVPLTAALVSRYSDRAYNSADEVEAMTDRLLAIADDWYGVEPLMEAAAAVIVGAPLPPPPSWADGRQRAPIAAEGLSQ